MERTPYEHWVGGLAAKARLALGALTNRRW